MSNSRQTFKEALRRRLLEQGGKALPTATLSRLSRTAGAMMRSGRMMMKHPDDAGDGPAEAFDLEQALALVASVGQLKGVAMKMGQIMSYIDVALPDELRAALEVLQTHSPPMPWERVQEIIRADLPHQGEALLARMTPEPVAAASIGQVHRAVLQGRAGEAEVAVKVRYPHVDQAIEADFGASRIGVTMAALFYPGARIKGFIDEAKARFLEECDYAHEAHCQARFARLYAGHPVITVPDVHPEYCGERVLTTRFVHGIPFDAYLAGDPPQEERDRLGVALFRFYVGTLFAHNLYNCDPHPGNYIFQGGGRVAMLDYGCTREFEPEFVGKLASLTRAVHADEPEGLRQAFRELGMVRQGKKYDFDTARDLVRGFYGPMLEDRTQRITLGDSDMGSMMRSKRQLMKLTLPGEFLFLFRIRFGLLSVLARLGARANWYRLERGFIEGR